MNSKKGLSRIMSALLAASSMIGGASAGKKKVGKRPNSAGVVVDKGGNNRKKQALRRRAKSAPPLLKNPKTYYFGVPTAIGVAGAGYGLYRLLSKGEKKEEEKKEIEVKDKLEEKDENKKGVEIEDKAEEKEEKFSKKVSELGGKYAQKLTDNELKDYLKFGVFRVCNWPCSEVEWKSLKDDESGKRKFDVCEFYVTSLAKLGIPSYVFRCGSSNGKLDEKGYDELGDTLQYSKDKYETGTAYLGVRLEFYAASKDYYVHYDYKDPVRSYAHAISNAVFFRELWERFEIGYYDLDEFVMKGSYIDEGIGYLDSFKKEIKTKIGDRYEENKKDIEKLFDNCKFLEDYYYEVLKAREEILVK